MATKKKTKYEDLPIGAKIFLVHKKYVDEKITGGKIIVCRVKSFCNKSGQIFPVYSEVGNSKNSPDPASHYLYTDIKLAIEGIRT